MSSPAENVDEGASAAAEPTRLCALCAKPATMLCSRCRGVAFCNSDCQRNAWRDHKPLCFPAATAETAIVPMGPTLEKTVKFGYEVPHGARTFEAVVAHMQSYPKDEKVMGRGVEALRCLALLPTKCAAMLKSPDVFRVLTSALRLHALHSNASSQKVCTGAINTLGSMLRWRPYPVVALAAADAISPLTAALSTHKGSRAVCSEASEVLGFIFSQSTPTGVFAANVAAPTFDLRALAVAALEPLVKALEMHSTDPEVCAHASLTVGSLCQNWSVRADAMEAGAILPLVSILCNHASHPAACSSAGKAISFIALRPTGKAALLVSGAAPLLVAALARHGGAQCPTALIALNNLGLKGDGSALP